MIRPNAIMKYSAVALLLLIVPLHLTAQEKSKLRLEQFSEIISVSGPQISPDGKEIIYTRGWVDMVNDSRPSDLFLMNADGSRNRFFEKGRAATWSPDGSRIAWLASGEPRGSQIFVRYRDIEGGATQITHVERTPSNMAWSPCGKFVAFNMMVPHSESWPIKLPARPDGARWTESPRIITDLVYRRDGTGFVEQGHTHIFLVPADGGAVRQLTSGNWNHSGVEWTPDGKEILFTSLRIEESEYAYRQSEIYAVNVETSEIRQITRRNGIDRSPVVSHDGRMVAYAGYDWTDDTYIESKLYIMNIDGSNPRELAANLDRSPSNITWAADNSGVWFTADYNGTRNLWFAPLRGDARQITTGNHMLSVSSINRNGMAAGILTDHHNPSDIVTFAVNRPNINKITNVNQALLSRIQLGAAEELWYKSTDNFDVHGWIIKPPNFDPSRKYPLILVIHGGPHAMYNVGFNFTWQHHAAEDYVVLYTNPRGSSGYGSAFGNAIKNAYPGKDYDDLMNGVDEVIKMGFIDEKNMFVYGGSGGGVLTSWIVGHTDRFAAASVNFPVINWLSFVGTTDGVSWYRNFREYPWDDPTEHLERSPLMYVGNVTTPTMLMCGENDLRTPIAQTEEYYQALKVLKVHTAMIRFRDEFHGTGSKPSNYLRTQLYLFS
jgi:dipeptidyl aminopeptidase/acylaminoacyl peptidase